VIIGPAFRPVWQPSILLREGALQIQLLEYITAIATNPTQQTTGNAMFNFMKPAETQARLTMQDIMAMVARDEMLLVDVRERGELAATGTAKGAIHVPVSLIALKADPKAPDHDKRFNLDKPIAVFCASGGRSGMAAQTLQRMGYKAYNLGGFGNWVQSGGQVVRI
jgi:rhodanese-related sulfurtransferase